MARVYPSEGEIYSGTWTPTVSSSQNLTTITPYEGHYQRVGNTVTCFGRIDVIPTTANSNAYFYMSIPIASDFDDLGNCGGSFSLYNQSATMASGNGTILGNNSTDSTIVRFVPTTNGSNLIYLYHFTYIVQ